MKMVLLLCMVFCESDGGLCGSKQIQNEPTGNQVHEVDVMAKEEMERHIHNSVLVRMQAIRARVAKMSLTDIGYYKFAKKVDLSDLELSGSQEAQFFKMLVDIRYQQNKDYFDEAGDGRVVAFVDKDDEISQPGSNGINYGVELTPANP